MINFKFFKLVSHKFIILFIFLVSFFTENQNLLISNSIAADNESMATTETKNEKKSEELFPNLEELIKKDKLEKSLAEKNAIQKKIESEIKKEEEKKEYFPKLNESWSLISEYYLVKNISKIPWDFEKPDYGIIVPFQFLLERLGYLNVKVKILLLNTPIIPHAALPSNRGEFILLISIPFIRSMDLSKIEISLLLLSDFLRALDGEFINKINLDEKDQQVFGNVINEKIDMSVIYKILKRYDEVLFKIGFADKNNSLVKEKLDPILKPYPELWATYIKLLNKIQNLISQDNLYSHYHEIYGSPKNMIELIDPTKKKEK